MSQEQLRRMLGESAAGIEVGGAPRFGGPRSRRRRIGPGLLVAGAVTVVAGGGVVVARLGDDRPPVASELADGPLLVAPPDDSGEGMDAGIQGRLAVDGRGCVVLDTMSGSYVALWPAGWSATVDGDRLVLRDRDGVEVGREGDYVSTGGGYIAQPDFADWRCYPRSDEVAVIQSEVQVTP